LFKMNFPLWGAQVLVAIIFAAAGTPKLLKPRASLADRMSWTRTASDMQVKGLGLLELLGAFGLVLPRALGVMPILTPVAATCLAIVMIGATAVRRAARESLALPVATGLGAAFVAIGRFALVP
jgi:hypothetical protein